jgi:phosphatidylglycerophosphate synthase
LLSVKDYRQRCQKLGEENYLLDKYVFRVFSIYFTIIFLALRIKANQATWMSLVAALASLPFIASTEESRWLIGAMLVFVYHLVDHVDGELARYYVSTGQQIPSSEGQYYDVLVHSFSANAMLLFMSFGIYRATGAEWIVVFGVLAFYGASGFPRLAAVRVLLQRIARDPVVAQESADVRIALGVLERKGRQVEALSAPRFSRKRLRKVVEELVGYPGMLFVIIGALVVDAFLNLPDVYLWGVPFGARSVIVVIAGTTAVAKLVLVTIQLGRIMRPIR